MSPLINLLHLKFFCDAVVYKSVSEAAKLNFVTQSAVSQAINKLEKIIGAELINHSKQKFQLTEEGQIVFDQARHIFKAVQETYDKIAQSKQEIAGRLNFVSTHSLTLSFIPEIFKQTKENYPGIDLRFRMGNLNFIRQALKNDEAEFAIVVYDNNFSQFAKQTLQKGKFNLYFRENTSHHLIENGIFVDHRDGLFVNELQTLNYKKAKSLSIQSELAGWEAVARFVEKGLGVGFLPDYILSGDRYGTLKIFPHKMLDFEYEICAIYNKENRLSRAAVAFLDQFEKKHKDATE